MTRFTVKAFGLIAWLGAVALTIELVREFTQGESIVTIGVAGLAILLSAFGLLFARYSWQQRAYPEIGFGLLMWIAGVGCLAFIELAYWTSSYDSRYERYAQEKTAKARQTGLEDRAWRSLTTGDIPQMPAQIKANIEAKKLDPAVTRSANCTNVTREDTRKTCQELFALQASLAAAEQRLRLEEQIKIALPKTQIDHLSSNVFAAADIIAEARGENAKNWSYLIIFWSWLLVTIVRDAGLLVANPLGRSQRAVQPSKSSLVAEAEKPETPALTRQTAAEMAFKIARPADARALEHVKAQMHAALQKPVAKPDVTIPPDGGGTPAPKPEETEKTPTPAIARLVVSNPIEESKVKKSSNRARKAKAREKKERLRREVVAWLDNTTTQSEKPTASGPCFDNYRTWCTFNRQEHVGFRAFTAIIKDAIGLDEVRRTGGGQTKLPIQLSNPASWQSQRRVA